MSLGVGFEFFKVNSIPASPFCLLLVYQDISFQLLLQSLACLFASKLPVTIIMDSSPLKLLPPL